MAPSDERTAIDLERLSRAEAPDLKEGLLAFLEQPGKVANVERQCCLASLVRPRAAHRGMELGGF